VSEDVERTELALNSGADFVKTVMNIRVPEMQGLFFSLSLSDRLTSNSWGKLCTIEFVTLMSLALSVITLAKINPKENQHTF
jgi:hypothetical protein